MFLNEKDKKNEFSEKAKIIAAQDSYVPLPYGNISTQILWLKCQKVSSMHACMQFDVYLSDPHYTEKVTVCCGNAEN